MRAEAGEYEGEGGGRHSKKNQWSEFWTATTSRIEKTFIPNPLQTRGVAQLGASLEVGHGRHQSAGGGERVEEVERKSGKEKKKRQQQLSNERIDEEKWDGEGDFFFLSFFCTLRLFLSFSSHSTPPNRGSFRPPRRGPAGALESRFFGCWPVVCRFRHQKIWEGQGKG